MSKVTGVWQDLRYSVRMLAKTPGFTLWALLALTLGIGVNSTMFSVVNALLLHPVHYPDPDHLVIVLSESVVKDIHQLPISDYDYDTFGRESHAFEQLAGIGSLDINLVLDGEPERLGGELVTANYFDMLRIRAAAGRTFRPEEDKPGHNQVAVISHRLWLRRFHGDSAAIGRSMALNGIDYTLVGVLPKDFMRLEDEDIWVPKVLEDVATSRQHRGMFIIGRLKNDKTVRDAQTELSQIAGRIAAAYPETNKDLGVSVALFQTMAISDTRTLVIALWAAVGFVLLIACANVANLLLVKANARRREVAIRLALGAARFRLMRQMLTESLLLALLGGGIGLLPSLWGVDLIRRSIVDPSGANETIRVDGAVLAYTLAVSVLTGICFGMFPAFASTRVGISEMLKQGSSRGNRGGGNRLRSAFVVAEISLALMLLIGASLMLKSFAKLRSVDPGFNPSNILTAKLTLPPIRYNVDEKEAAFQRDLLDRLRSIPGVLSAALTSNLPVNGDDASTAVYFPGAKEESSIGNATLIQHSSVSPDYFAAMQIRLLAGRAFDEHDNAKGTNVAIVNQKMAREYWPGVDPLGKTFKTTNKWWTVAGVVADIHHGGLETKPAPEIYLPYLQYPLRSVYMAVRTTARQGEIVPEIRKAVQSVDRDQPIYDIQTMHGRIAASVNTQQVTSTLCGVFAAVALILATIGIYAVMSFVVSQRTREIGIRMALGAEQRQVVRMVVGRGVWLIAAGLCIGTAAAAGIAQLITELLFGITATDPSTYGGVAAFLGAVALTASYVPARRAARVDPVIALRDE